MAFVITAMSSHARNNHLQEQTPRLKLYLTNICHAVTTKKKCTVRFFHIHQSVYLLSTCERARARLLICCLHQSAATTSTRVRDNQRRSRARRREYVIELERKLHEFQVNGIQPDVKTYETTAKRLEDENRKLRELLGRVGVSQPCIDAHLGKDCGIREYFDTSNTLIDTLPKDIEAVSRPCATTAFT